MSSRRPEAFSVQDARWPRQVADVSVIKRTASSQIIKTSAAQQQPAGMLLRNRQYTRQVTIASSALVLPYVSIIRRTTSSYIINTPAAPRHPAGMLLKSDNTPGKLQQPAVHSSSPTTLYGSYILHRPSRPLVQALFPLPCPAPRLTPLLADEELLCFLNINHSGEWVGGRLGVLLQTRLKRRCGRRRRRC